jgi:hypothetical protein
MLDINKYVYNNKNIKLSVKKCLIGPMMIIFDGTPSIRQAHTIKSSKDNLFSAMSFIDLCINQCLIEPL